MINRSFVAAYGRMIVHPDGFRFTGQFFGCNVRIHVGISEAIMLISVLVAREFRGPVGPHQSREKVVRRV